MHDLNYYSFFYLKNICRVCEKTSKAGITANEH